MTPLIEELLVDRLPPLHQEVEATLYQTNLDNTEERDTFFELMGDTIETIQHLPKGKANGLIMYS